MLFRFENIGLLPKRSGTCEPYDQRQARTMIPKRLKTVFGCPLHLKLELKLLRAWHISKDKGKFGVIYHHMPAYAYAHLPGYGDARCEMLHHASLEQLLEFTPPCETSD